MNKAYTRINWENEPSDATPLNETNLNRMDAAINEIDTRVVTMDTTKLSVVTANTMVKDVTFDEMTGIFTIEKLSGSKITINTALEKISTNFHFNPTTQKLALTLIDGTVQEIDLSALITQYEFIESDTIAFEIDASGKVVASVKKGSITQDMLEPNYLANIKVEVAKAESASLSADTSAKNAKTSENNAKTSEEKAREYAEASSGIGALISSFATGTNPTIQDSTNAPLIYGKFKGYTLQDGEPTPDNPVEINGLAKDGAIEVKTTGKNVLNNTASSKTLYGITVTVNDNKSVTLDGTATQDFIVTIGKFNNIDDNYILSGCPSGGSKSSYYLIASCRDENNEWKADDLELGNEKKLSNDYAKRLIQIGVKSGVTVSNLTFYPMIRKETITDNTYEPYTETTAAIPTDAPLYDGDYLEVYADGSGKVVRKMAKVVFDGSSDEKWEYNILSDGKANTFTIKCLNASKKLWNKKVGQYCSHFSVSTAGYSEYDCFSFNGYGTLVIQYAILTDVATWKTWLQSNPVTVVYELATPQEIELTAEQVAEFKKLYTFEPVTNVLCDGEVEMRYYKANDNGETVGIVHKKVEASEKTIEQLPNTFAKKSIYDNNAISYGRKVGSAVGEGSIAFGLDVEAPINYGVAVGVKTRAGDCAFACGHTNSANGLCSSASGFNTTVDGEYSHVEGAYTKASSNCQHVQGKYNVEDTEHKYAHIIGGGNSETDRKNIHTIDWNGNADFAGEVKCSNVLKTLTECEASTKDTDIAGASALAELNNSLTWKQLALESYGTTVNLPSYFNEIFVKVFSQNDDDNRRYALIVPQIALTETAKSYRIGYYYSSELSSAGIALLISSKTIQFGDSYLNGAQVNNLNFEIFYR